MKRTWKIAAAAICTLFLMTAAYAATAGGSDDPLITLSYLNNVFTPKVEEMADQAVAEQIEQLKTQLDGAIQAWDAKIREAMENGGSTDSSGGQGTGNGAVFAVVTLSRGQTLTCGIGCEVMLRIGTATCGVPDVEAGLIDVTGGTVLGNGGALVTNHLYMATIEDRTVTAGSNTVKVLVRGPYSVSG